MFWKYNSLAVSHLDTLLDKQSVTLTEILEQEDIIQECKSQNKKLVDYLTKQEILSELLDLILQEPSPDLEERLRFRLPNIASEVITCDVPQINEKLSSDTTLLDKMYAFLEAPPPLNPLLTSFFSKAFGVLISRRPEQNWYSYQYTCLQVIEYIKAKPGFTGLLLTHLATSAIMDLLLRLITCVEGTENKQNILTWLNEERLIQRVLQLLAPPAGVDAGGGGEGEGGQLEGGQVVKEVEPPRACLAEEHDNAGQLLVEIVRVSRDAQIAATATERFHNPLMATAESPETVQTLLAHMLDGPPVESCLVNGVEVLMALLEIRKPAPQGGFYQYTAQEDQTPNQAEIDRQQAVLETTADCIIPRLPQMTALLLKPPYRPPVATTCGVLEPPLGRTRLALVRLLATLLATSHPPLNLAIAQANTATILLDLFFKYSLNNFLHAQVESCLHSIIFWKQKAAAVTPKSTETADSSSLETPKIAEDIKEETESHPLEDRTMENPALVHLLTDASLMDRLVATWAVVSSDPSVAYMGHVTRISNHLVAGLGEEEGVEAPSKTLLLQLLARLPAETQASWKTICSGRLMETNSANELKPAVEEKRTLSSDDEDTDFRDIQFPQDSALQQMFSDYQMQEMSDNFIDSFGFQDDEFTESDENVSRGMRKLNSVNFLMQTDDSTKQAIFDSVCEQRIKAFSSSPDAGDTPASWEDREGGEDPWADRTAEITFGAADTAAPSRAGIEGEGASKEGGQGAGCSGEGGGGAEDSSDEEQEMAPDKMEVDPDQDPWETVEGPVSGPVAMDTSSPWGDAAPPAREESQLVAGQPELQTDSQESVGWADFGSASFSSGGGEGVASLLPQGVASLQGVEAVLASNDPGLEARDGWSPACASSPEATMLEGERGREGGASPCLQERLQEGSGDDEMAESTVTGGQVEKAPAVQEEQEAGGQVEVKEAGGQEQGSGDGSSPVAPEATEQSPPDSSSPSSP